jgi:hypothetical protein
MFDLTQEKALSPGEIPQLQTGSAVRVKCLPHDESVVIVLTPVQQ